MAHAPPKIVYGGATISDMNNMDTEKAISFLDVVEELGIKTIDTAVIYGNSEELLGSAHAASRFTIDTKYPGGLGSPPTKDAVVQFGHESLKKLQTKSVDIFYQHAPSPGTPLEDTLAGVDALYKAGAFKRFGLSNFTTDGVEIVIRIAKEHGYVLPTVYQGSYNAFGRLIEADLFPVLRRHDIAFYAYSPSAGGFLSKTSAALRNGTAGDRWNTNTIMGKLYGSLYAKPTLLDGLDTWNAIAKDEGITGIEMAYRWGAHHSKLDGNLGDGIIVGARTTEQLREVVGWINRGPLRTDAIRRIDDLWGKISREAPVDNYNSYLKKM